jgi:hypothetical protein
MNRLNFHKALIYSLRFDLDQWAFRKQRQVQGVFPEAMIHGALWRLEQLEHEMAGKQVKKYMDFGKVEFVNVTLNEAQKKEFLTWFKTEGERIADHLGQIMVDDYKVSCSWDDRNQCYIASFTGKEDQRVNEHKSMSSRSDDWYEALALNAYKHLVVFKGNTWDGETSKNNWG